jgi:glycyl-tRNA synthetase
MVTLDKIISLCKRRGFVYPSADIYGGLNGVYDFGPLGALLKDNIRTAWKRSLKKSGESILFFDGALLGSEQVWKASGHVDNFHDPMVDCLNCKKRYRSDDPDFDINKPCPSCGIKQWTAVRTFNMMFKTEVGASSESSSIAYLRPETAQSIFPQFKNIISTNRVKIPFGVAQIGKAFRNEITPKQFLFRMREFEQMEMEFFCKHEDSDRFFDIWQALRLSFYESVGLTMSKIRLRPHATDELAHYSKQCTDVEYEFPFGWKELEGIAHRGAYDLTQHATFSGKDLTVHDEQSNTHYTPEVVECSVGTDRLLLTLLFDAYQEDIIDGEERVVLNLHPSLAPIKAAIMPLTKKLSDNARTLFQTIAQETGLELIFDDSGSIGKRYRRQDEIGTPFCITYDFESLTDNSVTIRDRTTTTQQRIAIDHITQYLKMKFQ